jgi:Na+/H+ antiporter NhaD/arsenite permease-like protein
MAEIVAVVIFVAMFALIISDKIERHIVTLGCAAATIIGVFGICMHSLDAIWEVLNLRCIFTLGFWHASGESSGESLGINWATIIFIFGMMIMVEGMARVGFFQWLCMCIARLVNYRPMLLLLAFMGMSFVLSMFIDSITVILFLVTVTIELTRMLDVPPLPMIMAEIFCANLGGSATMCGDPPNIIIGTSLNYSFFDFLTNTGVIALVTMVVMLVYFFFIYRKVYGGVADVDASKLPKPESAITSQKGFAIHTLIFLLAVVLLITHGATGLSVAFIGTLIGILTLLVCGKMAGEILKRVDYKTLLFFMGLFVVVGGLEETGVLEVIATWIQDWSDGKRTMMVIIIVWVSALASAFVDNIPFAATMIPVIRSLSSVTGMPLDVLAWSLSIGTDIGGSATPIGASANVVGISVAGRAGYSLGWKEYCIKMFPATIIVLVISTAMIIARYL